MSEKIPMIISQEQLIVSELAPHAGGKPFAGMPDWYIEQLPWFLLVYGYEVDWPDDHRYEEERYFVQAPYLDYAKCLIMGHRGQNNRELPRGFTLSCAVPKLVPPVFEGTYRVTVIRIVDTCSQCGTRGITYDSWCYNCESELPF